MRQIATVKKRAKEPLSLADHLHTDTLRPAVVLRVILVSYI